MNDLSFSKIWTDIATQQEPPRYLKDDKEKVEFPNPHSQQPLTDTIMPYGYEDTKDYSYR